LRYESGQRCFEARHRGAEKHFPRARTLFAASPGGPGAAAEKWNRHRIAGDFADNSCGGDFLDRAGKSTPVEPPAQTTGSASSIAPTAPPAALTPNIAVAATPAIPATNSPALVAEAVPPKPAPLKLQAVFFTPPRSLAIINGQRVYVGDSVRELQVVAIGSNSAMLIGPNQTNFLTLE
jgi:hypothetical protein